MMQSSLGVLVVIAMLKEGFNFVGTVHWADEERSEGWEPEGNVRPLLHYRFIKGEREKMVTYWNSVWCYKCTIIPSDKRIYIKTITCKSYKNRQCQCTKQKHVRWIFVLFYLFIYLQSYAHKIIRKEDHHSLASHCTVDPLLIRINNQNRSQIKQKKISRKQNKFKFLRVSSTTAGAIESSLCYTWDRLFSRF